MSRREYEVALRRERESLASYEAALVTALRTMRECAPEAFTRVMAAVMAAETKH